MNSSQGAIHSNRGFEIRWNASAKAYNAWMTLISWKLSLGASEAHPLNMYIRFSYRWGPQKNIWAASCPYLHSGFYWHFPEKEFHANTRLPT